MTNKELKKIAAKPKAVMLHGGNFRIERYMAKDILVEYDGEAQEKIIELVRAGYLVDFSLIKKDDVVLDKFKNVVG
jgi:hypothetical protein